MGASSAEIDDLVLEALDAGLDDWAMLHTIVWIGRDAVADVATDDFRDVVRRLVERLVVDALMSVGGLGETASSRGRSLQRTRSDVSSGSARHSSGTP